MNDAKCSIPEWWANEPVYFHCKGLTFCWCWGPWRLGHEMMTKMMCTEEFLTRIPWKWGSELWQWQNCHGGISMSTQIIRYHDISNRLSAFFCGSKIVHFLLPGFSLLSNVSSDGNGFLLLLVHRVPFQDWIWSLLVFLNPPRAGKPIGFSRLTSFFSDTALRDVKKNSVHSFRVRSGLPSSLYCIELSSDDSFVNIGRLILVDGLLF